MDIYIIAGAVFVAAIIGTILSNFLIRKKQSKELENLDLEDKVMRLSQEALKSNNEQFLVLAKEVLGAQKDNMKIDLEGKKTQIEALIQEIRKDIKSHQDRIKETDEKQIKSFSALKQELEDYKKISGDLKISTDKLKSLLDNNQMRGSFGEQIAENLLKMAGFVIGQDYQINKAQSTQNTRPDVTIFLPDKTKINIDAKFPFSSLKRYIETEDQEDKKRFLALFKKDVKEKIKQASSRDYINPAENTVDFVILFIPNEMVFSYIYEKMNDVWEEAMKNKVMMAGPFSFTAILRMVKQAYVNFKYQKNLHQIITHIQMFDKEYQRFSESLDVLGKRIKSADAQFDVCSTTREKQLLKIVDKIKDQNIEELNETEKIG